MNQTLYRRFITLMTVLHLVAAIVIIAKLDTVESKIKREVIICKVETTAYNENFVMCESGGNKK